jgi:ABC-type multidrug transport system ATPase subunit
MEECEALCTRLVIMVNGEFKCLGSPKHLKLKFGSGYKVAIRLNNEIDSTKLLDFMKISFPTSILNEIHKNLIEFTLPFKDTKLSAIFGKIEENRIYLNIKDYSVSQTTLDQIFVDFAKAQEEEGVEIEKPHIYNTKDYKIENGFPNQNYHLVVPNFIQNDNTNELITNDDNRKLKTSYFYTVYFLNLLFLFRHR